MTLSGNERLIVALDHDEIDAARKLMDIIDDQVGFYKIGMGMLSSDGLDFAEEIISRRNKRLFLDLKLFDIASTVTRAVRTICRLGPDFLTVHGDPHVVRAAIEGRQDGRTRILAVTVLTSLSRADLDESMYVDGEVETIVLQRASLALGAGADGVICSPREARTIRTLPEAEGRLIVTPGIRLAEQESHDQKRVWTPERALEAGADYLVVGRPITRDPDPRRAASRFLREIEGRIS